MMHGVSKYLFVFMVTATGFSTARPNNLITEARRLQAKFISLYSRIKDDEEYRNTLVFPPRFVGYACHNKHLEELCLQNVLDELYDLEIRIFTAAQARLLSRQAALSDISSRTTFLCLQNLAGYFDSRYRVRMRDLSSADEWALGFYEEQTARIDDPLYKKRVKAYDILQELRQWLTDLQAWVRVASEKS